MAASGSQRRFPPLAFPALKYDYSANDIPSHPCFPSSPATVLSGAAQVTSTAVRRTRSLAAPTGSDFFLAPPSLSPGSSFTPCYTLPWRKRVLCWCPWDGFSPRSAATDSACVMWPCLRGDVAAGVWSGRPAGIAVL